MQAQIYTFNTVVELSEQLGKSKAKKTTCFYNTANSGYYFEVIGDDKNNVISASLADRKSNKYFNFIEIDKIDLEKFPAISWLKFNEATLIKNFSNEKSNDEFLKDYANNFKKTYKRTYEIVKGNTGVDTLKVLTVVESEKKNPKRGFNAVFLFVKSEVDNWSIVDQQTSDNLGYYVPIELPYPIQVLSYDVLSFAQNERYAGTVKTTYNINQRFTVNKQNKNN
ncbi:hypothetical protein [Flavobacterium sp.]|uniref:hypothetical protein n=1 Tax=Flavobacterium sp. TaxID=239 RepID=UPI002634A1A9|nr:hypothetical protein [Flavobacterium sp.]